MGPPPKSQRGAQTPLPEKYHPHHHNSSRDTCQTSTRTKNRQTPQSNPQTFKANWTHIFTKKQPKTHATPPGWSVPGLETGDKLEHNWKLLTPSSPTQPLTAILDPCHYLKEKSSTQRRELTI